MCSPMSGGRRIIPTGILGYNEHRRQAWECFCGLLSPELPAFVKIDNMTDGTIGSCDDCGLYDTDELFTLVSFDDKNDTATTTADYPVFDRYGETTQQSSQLLYLTEWHQLLGGVTLSIDEHHMPLQALNIGLVFRFVVPFSKTLMKMSLMCPPQTFLPQGSCWLELEAAILRPPSRESAHQLGPPPVDLHELMAALQRGTKSSSFAIAASRHILWNHLRLMSVTVTDHLPPL
ncbi:hypothetical protein K439DRAFT_1617116 [Ramaria rubella]|nr:hypothetical protein K439DRAFT_1617116 [Ramaria rubella]